MDKSLFILRPILACTFEQQQMVRKIRNQPAVRAAMYTDHEIGVDEHHAWLASLKTDRRQRVFVVLESGAHPVGVISASAIDERHKKADWAFYLSTETRGGLGAALEWHFIEYIFNEMKLEKLNCEVIATNQSVIKLHKKFSFVEEGFRHENIEKNGERIGVCFLGITRKMWLEKRHSVYDLCRAVVNKFEILFDKEAVFL